MLLLYSLEVQSQVSGDDGDVHEVDDVVVLTAVQILINVQSLETHVNIKTVSKKNRK